MKRRKLKDFWVLQSKNFVIPDGTEKHESTNINRSNLPSKGSRTNRRVINSNEPIRTDCRNKLLASMNIFISSYQYSEPTFPTTLKSIKIERRRTRSVFDRIRHDLRFLITTVYAFPIRVPIPESVEIYGRNRNDDFLSFSMFVPCNRTCALDIMYFHEENNPLGIRPNALTIPVIGNKHTYN